MAKKHWIYVKRGLSEDPKHRAQMGEAIWLFLHIIDRADWETGIAFEWKDSQEAAEMGMSVDTLRRQRQKLEDADYIRCTQKQRGQEICIMEWRNPRDYGSEIKNARVTSHESRPTDDSGLPQGLNHVPEQVKTPTSNSLSESLSEEYLELLKKSGLEWMLLSGEHTQEMIEKALAEYQHKQNSTRGFEKALGFSNPLPWWSSKEWTAFSEWVCQEYAKSKTSFGEYNIWRNEKFTKGGMANTRIRGFPTEFRDSWDMFQMSKKPQESRPTPKTYNPAEDIEPEYVPAPPRKR